MIKSIKIHFNSFFLVLKEFFMKDNPYAFSLYVKHGAICSDIHLECFIDDYKFGSKFITIPIITGLTSSEAERHLELIESSIRNLSLERKNGNTF